jgi:hypothetical protein
VKPHIRLIASDTQLRAAMARALMAAAMAWRSPKICGAGSCRRCRHRPGDRGIRMRVHAVVSDGVTAVTPHALPEDAAPDRSSHRSGRGDRPGR